jgi:hypothetical protein
MKHSMLSLFYAFQKIRRFSNFETPFIFTSLGIAHTQTHTESMSVNGELDELLSKPKVELLLLVKRLLPQKLWPRSISSKADIADAIQKAQRQPKIPSFFAAVPTLKASTSTASTDSSGPPAKKKSKPTDCINEEIASVISGSAKSDEAEEIASVISVSAKSDKAKEIASVISGSAKSEPRRSPQ